MDATTMLGPMRFSSACDREARSRDWQWMIEAMTMRGSAHDDAG